MCQKVPDESPDHGHVSRATVQDQVCWERSAGHPHALRRSGYAVKSRAWWMRGLLIKLPKVPEVNKKVL